VSPPRQPRDQSDRRLRGVRLQHGLARRMRHGRPRPRRNAPTEALTSLREPRGRPPGPRGHGTGWPTPRQRHHGRQRYKSAFPQLAWPVSGRGHNPRPPPPDERQTRPARRPGPGSTAAGTSTRPARGSGRQRPTDRQQPTTVIISSPAQTSTQTTLTQLYTTDGCPAEAAHKPSPATASVRGDRRPAVSGASGSADPPGSVRWSRDQRSDSGRVSPRWARGRSRGSRTRAPPR
jgi:hypothetical protein